MTSDIFVTFSVMRTKCKPNPCLNGGTCTDVNGGFECSCSFGYKGETCERKSYSFHVMSRKYYIHVHFLVAIQFIDVIYPRIFFPFLYIFGKDGAGTVPLY